MDALLLWALALLVFTAPVWGWLALFFLLSWFLDGAFADIARQREQREQRLIDKIAQRLGK